MANLRHKLTNPVFEQIAQVAETYKLETYVIGGYVRDLIMEIPSKDIDFVVAGSGIDLAQKVVKMTHEKAHLNYTYELSDDVKTKIEKVAKNIYGAKEVSYSKLAEEKIEYFEKLGLKDFFVNIAKTQFSFTDDKEVLGAPKDFVFRISDIEIRSGAKMVVAIAGNMLLMPGLAKSSNYLNIKLASHDKILGIF